jgi:AraC-like DNA-binding protein
MAFEEAQRLEQAASLHGAARSDPKSLSIRFFEARLFPTPVALAPWVEHVWVNRETAASRSYRFYRPPEIVTHIVFSIDSCSLHTGDRTLVNDAQMVLSGVQESLHSVPFPVSEALVLQLRPGGARALGVPMSALANKTVKVDEVLGKLARELTERVALEDCTKSRVELLCGLLARHFVEMDPAGQMVRRAGAFATACAAHERTRDLADRIGYSERQLRRVFADLFGLSPKALSTALRMNAVLHALDGRPNWADLASRHGYYDQSHFVHEFRTLIGQTPASFVHSLAEPRLLGGATVLTKENAQQRRSRES